MFWGMNGEEVTDRTIGIIIKGMDVLVSDMEMLSL